eukprot:TRINITY_DN20292_c0_g1_i4.p1 TRINITY_DN20292_c0_g1~~TRINITY_DN20292_c0_g1_i4.p1  ORF type:complete len:104 (-),score=30.91 TRINITY_DN20292_c0_g1_i4:31-342(-)
MFFFSSRRRHTRSVSAFLLNRSSDLGKITRKQIKMAAIAPPLKPFVEDVDFPRHVESVAEHFPEEQSELTLQCNPSGHGGQLPQIGRAVQQECRDRSRMPSSA